jgi:hypothetical protein
MTSLPKDVAKLGQEIKLFGKWDTQEFVMLIPIFSCVDSTSRQRRGQGHLVDRLHTSATRSLLATHGRAICQEAVQEGANAHRRASSR